MYNIGVDVGGTKIAFGIVNEKGIIIDRDILWNNLDTKSDEVIKNMAEKIDYLIKKNDLKAEQVNSIGIGFPAKVSNDGVVDAPNVAFHKVNVAQEIKRLIKDIPVYVENDANCATVGEYLYGSLKNSNSSVLITLGTGIGGGIIINGKLYRGQDGAAGELGHQVIMMEGNKCGCGRSGCWETYASTRALVDRLKNGVENNKNTLLYELADRDIGRITAKVFFEAVEKKDNYAIEMFKEHVKYIAVGIINLIQIFDPEILSIGGGVSGQKEKLLNPILNEIDEQLKEAVYTIGKTKICMAELGNDAGIIGAAELYRM